MARARGFFPKLVSRRRLARIRDLSRAIILAPRYETISPAIVVLYNHAAETMSQLARRCRRSLERMSDCWSAVIPIIIASRALAKRDSRRARSRMRSAASSLT